MNLKNLYKTIFKLIMFVLGFIVGLFIVNELQGNKFLITNKNYLNLVIKYLFSGIFGLIFLSLSNKVEGFFVNKINFIEDELLKKPIHEILFATIGLILGLLIAFLISQLINSMNLLIFGSIISIIVYFVFGYLGLSLAYKNTDYISNIIRDTQFPSKKRDNKDQLDHSNFKIIDTSAIIDGRILEIAKTGFLEGVFLIPLYVLEELQHIADNSDALKRNRGRRGLEVVDKLQNISEFKLILIDEDYDDIPEVDSKLIRLAKEKKGKIITNDFNLNKLASLQGIKVLNINELANAMKPVAIPGEPMIIQIVREGQEPEQGVGYLDDGTMIVVEKGKSEIGNTKEVIVTSVLQTNAGKMIFARLK